MVDTAFPPPPASPPTTPCKTIYTTNTEEFDNEGNVTKVENLVFIDGILGQGEGGGTVRLARRKFLRAGASSSGSSDGPAARLPAAVTPKALAPPSPHLRCAGKTSGSRRPRRYFLNKSASAPTDSSFFSKPWYDDCDGDVTEKSAGSERRQSKDDLQASPRRPCTPESVRREGPTNGRNHNIKKAPSVVGKLGLFTPSRSSFRFNDNDDEEDVEEELVAVKIFSKSILKRRRTMTRDKSTNRMKVNTALEQVEREIALMKKLSHPNLVALYEVIDSEESDMLYMVLQYMPLGEILTYQEGTGTFRRKNPRPKAAQDNRYNIEGIVDGHFTEEQAALFMVDILHGLAYLFEFHICHRDLKVRQSPRLGGTHK